MTNAEIKVNSIDSFGNQQTTSSPKRISWNRRYGQSFPAGSVFVGEKTKWNIPFHVVKRKGKYVIIHDNDPKLREIHKKYCNLFYDTKFEAKRDAVACYVLLKMPFNVEKPNMHDFHISMNFVLSVCDDLRGKDISCTCFDGEPCHGDVLLKIANLQ